MLMMTQWRLVRSGHLAGTMNMAIDEAIMRGVAKGAVPPTLRFYGWDPPAISVGYFQNVSKEVDPAACESVGVDVVRRPTGGRAVLHDVEVTYSLVVPEENQVIPKGITESYRSISEGMVHGFVQLGLDAKMVSLRKRRVPQAGGASRNGADENDPEARGNGSSRYQVTIDPPDRTSPSAACFDAPSWYEVTVEGKKIVGSAQMRRMGVLLQHGSIPLELQVDKLFTCLRFPSAEARERAKEIFRTKATSIREALGRPISFMEVCDAVVAGLQEILGVDITVGELTSEEKAEAKKLAKEKYAHLEWQRTEKAEEIQTA